MKVNEGEYQCVIIYSGKSVTNVRGGGDKSLAL
jgi:hypothetical protein